MLRISFPGGAMHSLTLQETHTGKSNSLPYNREEGGLTDGSASHQ